MLNQIKTAVVISPHPDDEVLGMGGLICRLVSLGCRVRVLFVSGHLPPLYERSCFDVTKAEACRAMAILGVSDYQFLEIPATTVAFEPVHLVNNKISSYIYAEGCIDAVFLPFPDIHIDHKVIFNAGNVACRPTNRHAPKIVACYETLSETFWNAPGIEPNFFPEITFDVSDFISQKVAALACYESQIHGNDSRSAEAVMALARLRGSQSGYRYAEGFKLVRLRV